MDADQMSLAVRTEITRRIPGIIESADLEKCTVKILQRQLEEGLKRDLGEHTDFIRLTVRDDDDDDDAMRGTMGRDDGRDRGRTALKESWTRATEGGERAGGSDHACARAFAHSRANACARMRVPSRGIRVHSRVRSDAGWETRCERRAD
jgi:hypothetical protein